MRFRSHDVRLFKGRGSIGVRGIRLKKDDFVISISVLNHIQTDIETRTLYLKAAASTRRGEKQDLMSENDFESMNNNDQYILTVTQNVMEKEHQHMNIELLIGGARNNKHRNV